MTDPGGVIGRGALGGPRPLHPVPAAALPFASARPAAPHTDLGAAPLRPSTGPAAPPGEQVPVEEALGPRRWYGRLSQPSRVVPLVALVIALTVGAVVNGREGDGPAPGEAFVEVDGLVVVRRAGGGTEQVTDRTRLQPGDRMEVRRGAAELELNDDVAFSALAASDGVAATNLEMGRLPELLGGPLLVTAPRATRVRAGDGTLALDGGSAARLTRSLASRVDVFRGRATLDSAGAERAVPTLRSAEVVADGEIGRTRPLDYDGRDPWDRRFLGAALRLDGQLAPLVAGMRSSGIDGDGLAARLRTAIDGAPSASTVASLIDERNGALDSAVGLAVVGSGRDGSFTERWRDGFRFHDAGAPWGLVAMDVDAPPDDVIDALTAALAGTPTDVSAIELAGATTGSTVPGGTTALPGAGGAPGTTAAGSGPDGAGSGGGPGTEPGGPGATVPGGGPLPGVTVPGGALPPVAVPGVTVPGVTVPGVPGVTVPPRVTVPGVSVPGVPITTPPLVVTVPTVPVVTTIVSILEPVTRPILGPTGPLAPVTGGGGLLGPVTGGGGLLGTVSQGLAAPTTLLPIVPDALPAIPVPELSVLPEVPLPELVVPDLPLPEPALPAVPELPLVEPALPVVVLPELVVPELPVLEPALPAVPELPLVEPALPVVVLPELVVPELPVLEPALPLVEPALPVVVLPELVVPELPALPAVPGLPLVEPALPVVVLPELVVPELPAVPELPLVEPALPVVVLPELESASPVVPLPELVEPALPVISGLAVPEVPIEPLPELSVPESPVAPEVAVPQLPAEPLPEVAGSVLPVEPLPLEAPPVVAVPLPDGPLASLR